MADKQVYETATHPTQMIGILMFTIVCSLNLNKLAYINKYYDHVTGNIKSNIVKVEK
jgi:hypothetical protein